jgi:hypothetical protein
MEGDIHCRSEWKEHWPVAAWPEAEIKVVTDLIKFTEPQSVTDSVRLIHSDSEDSREAFVTSPNVSSTVQPKGFNCDSLGFTGYLNGELQLQVFQE